MKKCQTTNTDPKPLRRIFAKNAHATYLQLIAILSNTVGRIISITRITQGKCFYFKKEKAEERQFY